MSEAVVEKTEKKSSPNSMVKLTVTLGAICAACALVLGVVYTVTGPAIAANEKAKTEAAMAAVLPAESYTEVYNKETAEVRLDATINAINAAGDKGYVVEVSPAGSFSGTLTIMVGVDAEGTVTGVEIVKHAETSGLGANATKPDFKARFEGKTGTVAVTKDGGEIVPITGATITSRAVCSGVTTAIQAVESLG